MVCGRPERFNEWVAFDSRRMAPVGTFTNGEMTNRMSKVTDTGVKASHSYDRLPTSQGTTADVTVSTEVEVYHKEHRTWWRQARPLL